MSFTSGLPPIDASQLPADVRAASPARQSAYEAGMGFEQMLVQQLSQSLTDSSGDTSSSDDSTGGSGGLGGDSPYASLLPDALTSGVMDARRPRPRASTDGRDRARGAGHARCRRPAAPRRAERQHRPRPPRRARRMSATAAPPVPACDRPAPRGRRARAPRRADRLDQRLLEIALAQGVAIRAQDVDAVVRQVSGLPGRARAPQPRRGRPHRLLARAGTLLGDRPGAVTLYAADRDDEPAGRALAAARSGELRACSPS